MIEFIKDLGPWAVLAISVAAVAAAVVYLPNKKIAFVVGVVGAIVTAFSFGRRGGQKTVREDIRRETENVVEREVERAEDARVESDRRNADPTELRNDDGFRRAD